jgi:biopolymer transport protein ExbB/TolQ
MLLWFVTSLALAAETEAPKGFTLGAIWSDSGWLARGVIIMLALMFVGSVFTGIERLIAFNRARGQSMQLAAEVIRPLRDGDVAGAKKLASDERFKASYLAAVLRNGLTEIESNTNHFGLENAERAVAKAVNEELAKLKRGMTILATTGSTAPFVGLFGTTFGVIHAFEKMSSGGAGLASVSSGISEALFTTGVGIAVAVVGVWMYNYFNLRTEKVTEELASSEADFLDWAAKHVNKATGMQAAGAK